MGNGLIKFLDSLLSWVSTMSKEPATAFCELETVDSDGKTLVASDGSLGTIISVAGSSRLVGRDEYHEIVKRFTKTLATFLAAPGHTLQIYFSRDPEGGVELVRHALRGARSQAKSLMLDFEDVIDEQEREVAKWVADESVYFVCWTHPGVLTPAEAKSAKINQDQENAVYSGFNFLDAQNPRVLISSLRNRHSAFVSSVSSTFKEVGLMARQMDVHDALRAVRQSVDPQWTPASWKPTVPGDRIPARFPMRVEETSAVWWPPLASQVWPRDAHVQDEGYVKIGDRLHAPMYVEIPGRIEPFDRLIDRALGLDRQMPFAISFIIKGGGLKGQNLKGTIASVLAVFSSFNAQIRDSLTELKELSINESVVSLQVAFNTWAPAGKTDLLRERASRMAQAVIDWGGAQVRQVTGDPVEGFTSTGLALTANSIATEAAAPLRDVVPMFPLTQPASPWTEGSEIFTSPSGKIMPYQPGSSLMQTWINIWIGSPGSGKSVQINKHHKATILSPDGGTGAIPRVAMIDFGMSSSGFVSLFKQALPPNKQHLVNWFRIKNTQEFAMNMFDLPLGLEYPPPEQRALLVDMLTLLATPPESGKPFESMAALAGIVVDVLYKNFANNSSGVKVYSPSTDVDVDNAIAVHGIELPKHASWYDVRDCLFKAGLIHEAYLASRYAVPTLADAASAVRDPAVTDMYERGEMKTASNERLTDAFSRLIMSALRDYPVLSTHTKFDIGESRITIFDLDQVVKGSGVAGGKQSAVMLALSFYTLTKDFMLHPDDVDMYPTMYREYQYGRALASQREMKTVTVDEFHRIQVGFADTIRNQFKVIGREGRKWKIALNLGSQSLTHFDSELIDLATGLYIMDRPDGNLLADYKERFTLSDTECAALTEHVHGPRAGGGTFFARMKLKEGYYIQLLRNPAGPIELWALTSTLEDKAVRSLVYAALGAVDGRSALASTYPGGSAAKDIEQRKVNLALRGESLINGAEDDLYTQVANEVITSFRKQRAEETRKEIAEQQFRKQMAEKRAGG